MVETVEEIFETYSSLVESKHRFVSEVFLVFFFQENDVQTGKIVVYFKWDYLFRLKRKKAIFSYIPYIKCEKLFSNKTCNFHTHSVWQPRNLGNTFISHC